MRTKSIYTPQSQIKSENQLVFSVTQHKTWVNALNSSVVRYCTLQPMSYQLFLDDWRNLWKMFNIACYVSICKTVYVTLR